tara:strand:- start:294 stop:680 length:387 start_codon:yes stop_codon:yes gene_type:complete
VKINKNILIKYLWLTLGLLCFLIGSVGIIVPGLPTTIMMILAAACFFRSSEKLYNWVIENKYYGHHVKNFREEGGMPKKAKLMAIGTMWTFVSFAVLFGIPDHMLIIKILTILGAATGTGYVISLRTI